MNRKTRFVIVPFVLAAISFLLPQLALADSKLEYWTWNNEGDYVKVDDSAIARFETTCVQEF